MKEIKLLLILLVVATTLFAPSVTKAKTDGNPTRVIYVQNGGIVKDENWNNGIKFNVKPYTNTAELDQAIEITKTHFSVFDILITTDERTYKSYDAFHRTKIIVGSTKVLGLYPGYAWQDSYTWGKDTPGFVLTNNCNPKSMVTDIGHLIAHESGHIFGLDDELNTTLMGNFTGNQLVTWDSLDFKVLTGALGLKANNNSNILALR